MPVLASRLATCFSTVRGDRNIRSAISRLPRPERDRLADPVLYRAFFAADRESFRFRHALTHEAVLAGLLPPERALLAGRALAAVEAAHPGLPGAWCMLAAELAERAGNAARAGALLLEAGRRDLAVGALASAEHTLTRARTLIGPDDATLRTPVDEALTEVFAMSGQVDRAIETGRMLLARLGPPSPRAATEVKGFSPRWRARPSR